MITKQKFIELIDFIKDKREKWDNLTKAMEAVCPGNYVDFWPHFDYETKIIELLDIEFGFESEFSPIDLFFYEGELGKAKKYLTFEETINGKTKTIDITTPTKLYNYCVKIAKLSRE